ncbi:Smr/MutS family protein [Mesomycoplasma neurolyticum]|nr:Smr/MutS family protein [Mesomycoplasma neurolyticum]
MIFNNQTFDFHGLFGDEAKIKLMHILKEFKESNFYSIRIVVGKGTGRLKQVISSHLESENWNFLYDNYYAVFTIYNDSNNYSDSQEINEDFEYYFNKLKN